MSSKFNRRILAQAKRSVSNRQQADADTIDDETLRTIGVNFDEAFNEGPDLDNTEEDAEDQFRDSIDRGKKFRPFPMRSRSLLRKASSRWTTLLQHVLQWKCGCSWALKPPL